MQKSGGPVGGVRSGGGGGGGGGEGRCEPRIGVNVKRKKNGRGPVGGRGSGRHTDQTDRIRFR